MKYTDEFGERVEVEVNNDVTDISDNTIEFFGVMDDIGIVTKDVKADENE